jgi:hypothetical protein
MLNSEFTNTEAQRMAQNILQTVDVSDVTGQVTEVLQRTTQRQIAEGEVQKGVEFIHRLRSRDGADPQQALARFCLLSINLNEFLFVN